MLGWTASSGTGHQEQCRAGLSLALWLVCGRACYLTYLSLFCLAACLPACPLALLQSSRGSDGRARLLLAVGPESGWEEPYELEMFHSFGFQVGRAAPRSDHGKEGSASQGRQATQTAYCHAWIVMDTRMVKSDVLLCCYCCRVIVCSKCPWVLASSAPRRRCLPCWPWHTTSSTPSTDATPAAVAAASHQQPSLA